MATRNTRKKAEEITPEFRYCRDILEPRWDVAFRLAGLRKMPRGKRRLAEKKRLVFRCEKLYQPFECYINPTHWLHIDAIGILLRDYYKA